MHELSLKKRIISPTIIILVILIITMIAYPSIMYTDYFKKHYHDKNILVANSIRDYLNICDRATRAAAVSGSVTPDIIKATKERDTKEIVRHLIPMLELYGVDFYTVTDTEGNVLAQTHDPDNSDFSIPSDENIADALNGLISTNYVLDNVTKVAACSYAPIFDTDGSLIGIITSGIRLDSSDSLLRLKERRGADFTVYLGDEVLTTVIMKDGKRLTDRLIDQQTASAVLQDNKEFMGYTDIMGENKFVYIMPLLNSKGEAFAIICAESSNAEFIEKRSAVLFGGFIIGSLGLICLASVLLFIITNITKPVIKLNSLVSEVANGNINTDVNRPIIVKDEIGALASNIYLLNDIISSMACDLSQLNRNLSINSEMDYRIDSSRYCGAYKEIVDNIGALCNGISSMHKVLTNMDNMQVMSIAVDLDFNLIFVNPSLAKTFDLNIEECKGKKCHKVIRNLDEPCPICLLPDMMDNKEELPYQDYDYLYDDTFGMWLGGRAAIIRWIDGSLVYFQTFSDVTEKKRTQEQLVDALEATEVAEAASKAKSGFLANMSHEFRTSLNVIIGLANLQLEDDDTPESVKENLHKINSASATLLSIINDILDISKIESGKFTLAPVEYHMASLLNDTAILITSRIGVKPVIFNLDIKEDLPSRLYGDDLRVKQILLNLLSNSIKYTNSGFIELCVNCVREGDSDVWMEITVKDTGIGINSEDLKKLFSDYNQVDTQANRKVEGTGLGLAITKKLVESMDGTITVESIYGVGSAFRVRIRQGFVEDAPPIGPIVVQNLRNLRYGENKRNFVSHLIRPDLSYAKVLVVDDMQTNLNVSAGLMRKYKMQVDCVTSGQAAVDSVKRAEPVYNAIFMDHMMPGMDGIEATAKIRALGTEYAKTIPIIALTANVIAGTEDMFYEHGFQAYIAKPIDIMRLDSIIQRWIKNNQNDNLLYTTPDSMSISDTPASDSLLEEQNIEIPGLDTNKGIASCNGDYSIYLSVLRAYVDDIFDVLDRIRDVSEDTLSVYTTTVHGIKGSSAIIGAEKIREAAANLELMGKNGDITGILAHNEDFLKETASLLSNIKDWLIEYDDKTNA